jgi:hypothetical protein
MAQTAVRADTQVKGKLLNLGGAVTGYFDGDANGDGTIILTDANGVDQIILDAGATGANFQGEFTGNVSVGGLTITGPATNILVEDFGTADLNTIDVLRPDGTGGLVFDQLDNTDVGLGNVTDDAQLKREANDFVSFSQKSVPVATDVILIEDSAASGVKKYVELADLTAVGGDVDGPTGAFDNAVVRFDGTTGKIIKNSGVILDNSDNFSGIVDITLTGTVDGRDVSADGLVLDDHVAAATGVHGIVGAVVGTTDAQTLSVKTLVTPTIADFTNATHDHSAASGGGIVDHVDLANIGSNTHSQIDTHISSTSNPHSVTKSQVGLGNVTDDAQLKRAANDFSTFSQKTVPDADDIVLIEDSAAVGVKKYVKLSDVSSTGIAMINTAQIDRNGAGFIEIFGFRTNLRKAFPSGMVLQIKSFNSDAGVQGRYRLFNVSDATTLVSLDNTTGSLTPIIYESATISATGIVDAVKEYSFEHTRVSGGGASDKTSLRGALLRRP